MAPLITRTETGVDRGGVGRCLWPEWGRCRWLYCRFFIYIIYLRIRIYLFTHLRIHSLNISYIFIVYLSIYLSSVYLFSMCIIHYLSIIPTKYSSFDHLYINYFHYLFIFYLLKAFIHSFIYLSTSFFGGIWGCWAFLRYSFYCLVSDFFSMYSLVKREKK